MRSLTTLVALLAATVATSLLVGCGKEVGRIPLRAEGQGEASVQATAGKELALWTALDVKMKGDIVARYDVELVQDGAVVAKAQCDPFDVNVKTGSKEITMGDDRSVSWSGKMRCGLTPAKTGPAIVRAKLSIPQRPATLTVKDMSLVIKE